MMLGLNPTFSAPPTTALLYSGEQFDVDLQQQYLRARYYDQSIGVFNRLDPFSGIHSDPQSLHKYTYTHLDPINATDPSGRVTLPEINVVQAITISFSAVIGGKIGETYFNAKGRVWGFAIGATVGTIMAAAASPGVIVATATQAPTLFASVAARMAVGLGTSWQSVVKFFNRVPSQIEKARYIDTAYIEQLKNSPIIIGRFGQHMGKIINLANSLGAKVIDGKIGLNTATQAKNIQSIIQSSPQVYIRMNDVLNSPKSFTYTNELVYIFNKPSIWWKVTVIKESGGFVTLVAQTGFIP